MIVNRANADTSTLSVTTLADGAAVSSIGASPATAGFLALQGGTLRYTGPAVTTNRLFTVGVPGGKLDASGTGSVTFGSAGGNNVASDTAVGTYSVTTGSTNVSFGAAGVQNVAVGQTITGTGIPAGTTISAVNYDTGAFTISNAATATGATTSLTFGAANRVLTLTGTNTGANTVASVLANSAAGGRLGVTKTNSGNWVLTAANTYTGDTTVTGGTLTATAPAYSGTVLGSGTGGLNVQGGRFVFDYTGGGSPVATVKSILTAGYAGNFASGQIRSTGLPAGRTVGYGETGGSTVTVRVTLPGDADLNGAVDFNDFAILQTSFGQSNVTFAQGDFNYSDSVDFNDFALLQTNFGQSVGGARAVFTREQYAAVMSITNASQVPEPAALAVLGLSAAGLLRRRRA